MWYPTIIYNNYNNNINYSKKVSQLPIKYTNQDIENVVSYFKTHAWTNDGEYKTFAFGWYCTLDYGTSGDLQDVLHIISLDDVVVQVSNDNSTLACDDYGNCTHEHPVEWEWHFKGGFPLILCDHCKVYLTRLLHSPIVRDEYHLNPLQDHYVYESRDMWIRMRYSREPGYFPYRRMMYIYSTCKQVLMIELRIVELAHEIIMYVLSGLDAGLMDEGGKEWWSTEHGRRG